MTNKFIPPKRCPNCGKVYDGAYSICRYCNTYLERIEQEFGKLRKKGRRKW